MRLFTAAVAFCAYVAASTAPNDAVTALILLSAVAWGAVGYVMIVVIDWLRDKRSAA